MKKVGSFGLNIFVDADLSRSLTRDKIGTTPELEICNCDGKLRSVIACLVNTEKALDPEDKLGDEGVLACRAAIECALDGIRIRGGQMPKK